MDTKTSPLSAWKTAYHKAVLQLLGAVKNTLVVLDKGQDSPKAIGEMDTLKPDLTPQENTVYDAIVLCQNSHFNQTALELALVPKTKEKSAEVLEEVKKQFQNVQVQFTDAQIQEFYDTRGKNHPEDLPAFFKNLLSNGNITQKQYEESLKKYCSAQNLPQDLPVDSLAKDILEHLPLLSETGILTVLVGPMESKYHDEAFFAHIIANPTIRYREEVLPVSESLSGLGIFIQRV